MRQVIKDFEKYGYFLQELIRRDFHKKYYRSVLGILWTILNPLLMMGIITIVFSTLFERSIENYPVYYLCGILIFNFCKDASMQSLGALTANAGLMRKIYLPSYFFPLSKVALSLVNFLFSMIPLVLVALFTRARLHWTFLLFPLPVLLAAGFTVGLSLALAAMAVYFRDLNHLYGLVTLAWTYLTPLFYPISIIPAQWMLLLRFNPMLYYVGIFRALVYEGVLPPVLDWVIAGLFSILTLSGGCLIFHALKKGFFLHL